MVIAKHTQWLSKLVHRCETGQLLSNQLVFCRLKSTFRVRCFKYNLVEIVWFDSMANLNFTCIILWLFYLHPHGGRIRFVLPVVLVDVFTYTYLIIIVEGNGVYIVLWDSRGHPTLPPQPFCIITALLCCCWSHLTTRPPPCYYWGIMLCMVPVSSKDETILLFYNMV